jgi:hypothetical protein
LSGANTRKLEPTPDELFRWQLPDGRIGTVIPLTFGRARLCVQRRPEDCWYDDGW